MKNGKPLIILHKKKKIQSADISISHDGKYAFSTAVFLFK
jgi:phosphopantetheinyl transferase (holo-ACP synthase)